MNRVIPKLIKQNARIVGVVLVALGSIGPVTSISAKSHRVKDQPVIRVGVYNYAKIDPSQLHQAESQATAVFAMAGVRIVWKECSPKPASVWSPSNNPNPDFFVRILHTSVIKQAQRASGVDVMGESVIPRGNKGPVAGGIANVYYDRVKEVSAAWAPSTSAVLGEAIAHELGHLMLGPQHSRYGTMKILWTYQDQVLISHCELRFLPGQAKDLRDAARSLQQDSSPMVVARR